MFFFLLLFNFSVILFIIRVDLQKILVIIDFCSISLSKEPVNVYPHVEFYDSEGMTAESFPVNKWGRVTRRSNSLADKVDHRALAI